MKKLSLMEFAKHATCCLFYVSISYSTKLVKFDDLLTTKKHHPRLTSFFLLLDASIR
jgi:hypothetical protein